jgi:microcin C transport system substrate-binding protein
MKQLRITSIIFALTLWLVNGVQAASSQAMGYTPKYPDNFSHFDYVNPDAPRGGELVLSGFGSFDNLNPFILKGVSADGLGSLMFESLMQKSLDEPFSQYGLLAEDAVLAEDKLSVTFRLRSAARFNDSSPVTAADVKFSFDILKSDKGHPQYRFYYADIERAVVVDERTVRFEFARANPELHLIAGEIPIFARNWVGDKNFDKVAMEMPISSGPYLIEKYDLGKNITYRRNPDYWGNRLNVRQGMYNFERVTYKYYRDFTVALEAFKAGEFEFILENNSKKWARDYVGPKFRKGLITKTQLKHANNAGMQGFVFNLRRPLFKDKRVRKAISLTLDFDWSNRQLFYNQYDRCDSYFSNSELAARGLPQGDELALLEPYREQLPPELFTTEWRPPSTTPPASLRANLREAKALLTEAGWTFRDGALRNAKDEPFRFDVVLAQKGFERIIAPFARNLGKLGISVDYRTVDTALYKRRIDEFDFDMVVSSFGASQSPGNELMSVFHSSSAEQKGTRNLFGLKDSVVDAMVEKVIYATDRATLVTAVHALDRVLLHGEYLVPHWFIGTHRVAYWSGRFGQPETMPLYYSAEELVLSTWWDIEEQNN